MFARTIKVPTNFLTSYFTMALIAVAMMRCVAFAEEKSAALSTEQTQFFEAKVRPLLAEHCFRCHGPEEVKGGLRLDSKNSILEGGESGAAVVVGKPKESLLIEAVRYESLEMPPDGRISEDNVAILTKWIEMGLPFPGSVEGPSIREIRDRFSDEDRTWWALQPVSKPKLPEITALPGLPVEQWKKNPIDSFIFKKMALEGFTPADEADRVSLLRRLALDLTGLPPSSDQVRKFVEDSSPDAYERMVDELLDSPRYGERWARHWLDLVRYADSDGYRIDNYRPNSWRYRDYVIDAFNNDKPYDRFVQEQLAGDELFPEDAQAQIATGFMRHWIYEYNNRDVKTQWYTILNDVTDTTSDVFLGLGLQCAKCHDHKFDPLLQKDYFRLRAFFEPIISREFIVASQEEQQSYAEKLKAWETATTDLRDQIEAIEAKYRSQASKDAIIKFPTDIQAILTKPEVEQTPYERQIYEIAYRQVDYEYARLETKLKGDDKETVIALRKTLSAFDDQKPDPLPTALTVEDVGAEAPPTLIPKRAKQSIAPGAPTLFNASDMSIETVAGKATTQRRTALAKWLTDPNNPLTARVMVNRLWQYHFGRGLAANASDFGKLGGPPSHPELLDWLSATFVEDGWSLKRLHRLMVTSATYRQSTKHPRFDDFQARDPANQFYWRGDTRRLDAEQIRDSILLVSGQLKQAEVIESTLEKKADNGLPDLERLRSQRIVGGEGVLTSIPRRSIFTRVMRNARDPLLDIFDLPQFFSSESSRNTTTTPVQSLMLINSPEMLRYASTFAERVWKEADQTTARIQQVYQRAYSRMPTAGEQIAAIQFLKEHEQQLAGQIHHESVVETAKRETGQIPYRDGQAILVSKDKESVAGPMRIPDDRRLDLNRWSIETYFQIRSIDAAASVRTAVSKWSGKSGESGWTFGVTGKGSRRKPQTLVVVMWGKKRDGTFGEAAVFSDQYVELNKPYFAAASIEPATVEKPGIVTFHLKDLSNDDDPMSSLKVEHDIVGGLENDQPLTIGACSATNRAVFDGLIDDVRISSNVVPVSRLLLTAESVAESTVGYWRFEAEPGVMRDSSSNQLNIQNSSETKTKKKPQDFAFTAFVDLCHAIFNSNEFLYVD
ncbi:MAG: PSD1 and planctomycete cytochrome C domain-containing protein [Pirellulaceae bacterium]|nr:PSD1 and planctomycete cytochrome C domain-containing protein [Pirellulaceae bacterium]